MSRHDYVLLALAALIFAAAFAFLPSASATGESIAPDKIDLSGLNRNGGYLLEDDIPAH
jgi:hypothetical protein